jgi:hypothetical protein
LAFAQCSGPWRPAASRARRIAPRPRSACGVPGHGCPRSRSADRRSAAGACLRRSPPRPTSPPRPSPISRECGRSRTSARTPPRPAPSPGCTRCGAPACDRRRDRSAASCARSRRRGRRGTVRSSARRGPRPSRTASSTSSRGSSFPGHSAPTAARRCRVAVRQKPVVGARRERRAAAQRRVVRRHRDARAHFGRRSVSVRDRPHRTRGHVSADGDPANTCVAAAPKSGRIPRAPPARLCPVDGGR